MTQDSCQLPRTCPVIMWEVPCFFFSVIYAHVHTSFSLKPATIFKCHRIFTTTQSYSGSRFISANYEFQEHIGN